MQKELTKEELNERVAILRRYRTLLEQQRAKFQEYLEALESHEARIDAEDSDSILAHTEFEERLVTSIGELQKAIAPMQKLYESSGAATYNVQDAVPVQGLRKDLDMLRKKALAQNERNKELLRTHMTQLRTQIAGFKNPYTSRQSVYAERGISGSMVQIEV